MTFLEDQIGHVIYVHRQCTILGSKTRALRVRCVKNAHPYAQLADEEPSLRGERRTVIDHCAIFLRAAVVVPTGHVENGTAVTAFDTAAHLLDLGRTDTG